MLDLNLEKDKAQFISMTRKSTWGKMIYILLQKAFEIKSSIIIGSLHISYYYHYIYLCDIILIEIVEFQTFRDLI